MNYRTLDKKGYQGTRKKRWEKSLVTSSLDRRMHTECIIYKNQMYFKPPDPYVGGSTVYFILYILKIFRHTGTSRCFGQVTEP